MKAKHLKEQGKIEVKEEIVPKQKDIEQFDNKVLTEKDYQTLWGQMTVKFTESEPIVAMCCARAQKFTIKDDVLNIGFEYGTNMLIVDDEHNKKIMLEELFKNRKALKTNFYLIEKPVDEVKIKIDRLKTVFDKNILKITKK